MTGLDPEPWATTQPVRDLDAVRVRFKSGANLRLTEMLLTGMCLSHKPADSSRSPAKREDPPPGGTFDRLGNVIFDRRIARTFREPLGSARNPRQEARASRAYRWARNTRYWIARGHHLPALLHHFASTMWCRRTDLAQIRLCNSLRGKSSESLA
jgi:hypothetical protein